MSQLQRSSNGSIRNYSKSKRGRKISEEKAAELFRTIKNKEQLRTIFELLINSKQINDMKNVIKMSNLNKAATLIQRSYKDYKICPICMESGANYVLNCGHAFHKSCLQKMYQHAIIQTPETNVQLRCPMCRGNIGNERIKNILKKNIRRIGQLYVNVFLKPPYEFKLKQQGNNKYVENIDYRKHDKLRGHFFGPFVDFDDLPGTPQKHPYGKGIFKSEKHNLVYIGNLMNSFALPEQYYRKGRYGSGRPLLFSGKGLIYEEVHQDNIPRTRHSIQKQKKLSGNLMEDLKNQKVEYVFFGLFKQNNPDGLGTLLQCPNNANKVFQLTHGYFTKDGPQKILVNKEFPSLEKALKYQFMKELIIFSELEFSLPTYLR